MFLETRCTADYTATLDCAPKQPEVIISAVEKWCKNQKMRRKSTETPIPTYTRFWGKFSKMTGSFVQYST